MASREHGDPGDPLWYKDAVIYELPVKSFYDGNGDGVGDFRGLIEKLDYLEDLGITAIWLLPFYPSPMKDDGYDITDYLEVHPDYGTLHDFREFLHAAHGRGIRVITELVLNHTSDQHPWFRKSRNSKPGTEWRNFYVWSDTPESYGGARIIFKDFESSNWKWDPAAKAYFWHRFYSHQPDLNYDSPRVQRTILRVVEFWLEMGVDGLRLDAVPYLYEREGTICENLPETHLFLKKLRACVDGKFRGRMLIAEANQWPEDAAAYFGQGDECHMAFHFPLMSRMFMSLWMEDRFPVVDILDQAPSIPPECQWALFLRNHDELTLEMVTDEERDYMYHVYARDPRARINLGIRRRLAPLLNDNRRKMGLMNVLLFSLPGTPVIYYGDEIGMGDNYYLGDRNGVRTPMQWSADRNAGFSRANPQKLYLPVNIDPEYHYEAVNVEVQETNPSSFLWWMKRVIATRKRFKAFGRGGLTFLPPSNPHVLAFTRQHGDEVLLVVANLSRFCQAAEIDLSRYGGFVPEEAFSGNRFPRIKDSPYPLTVGVNDYYLFVLRDERKAAFEVREAALPEIKMEGSWDEVTKGRLGGGLAGEIIHACMERFGWFGGMAEAVKEVKILDQVSIPLRGPDALLLLVEVHYLGRLPETHFLPLSVATRDMALKVRQEFPRAVIARLSFEGQEGFLYDGIYNEKVRSFLLELIAMKKSLATGNRGKLAGRPSRMFRKTRSRRGRLDSLTSRVVQIGRKSSFVLFGESLFMKVYRQPGEGINPEIEIVQFLTEKGKFENAPAFYGCLEYASEGAGELSLCLLEGAAPHQVDGWTYAMNELGRYFERILSSRKDVGGAPQVPSFLSGPEGAEVPPLLREAVGEFCIGMVRLLARRTAGMHMALSLQADDESFAPEPFSELYRRSLYQSMRSLARRTLEMLRESLERLAERERSEAAGVLASEQRILKFLGRILERRFESLKIRIHGDFHLGEVLVTGKDFVIIDFEGDRRQPLYERRLKRSPLRDVASMMASFHHAAWSAFFRHVKARPGDAGFLEPWVEAWQHLVGTIFFTSYVKAMGGSPLIPGSRDDIATLLEILMLERAIDRLWEELGDPSGCVIIPVRLVRDIVGIS